MTNSWLTILLVLLVNLCDSAVIPKGYLHADTEYSLTFNSTNPDDCLEYKFMTNYKKVFFDLVTTPTTKANFKQRIILTDMPNTVCPQKCTELPNYCTAISNRLYSETQATFSKWFPTLYIYVINQPPTATLLSEFIDEALTVENSDQDNIELATVNINSSELVDIQEVSETTPIFKIKPSHLTVGCRVLQSVQPRWAALSNSDCINSAFCTTEWGLLQCQSAEKNTLFSLCTSSEETEEELLKICSAHSEYSPNYLWQKCENPIEYSSSLSETAVSIFLLSLVLMTLFIFYVCCFSIFYFFDKSETITYLPIFPECFFKKEIDDDRLYNDNSEEEVK